MKKNSIFAIVALATITLFSNCGNDEAKVTNENPKGLYRLESVGYENGNPDRLPNMEQYKYCGEEMVLNLSVHSTRGGTSAIYMNRNEKKPLVYTGAPLEDNKETALVEVGQDSFTMRWYNRKHNTSLFPEEQYIHEHYSRNYMSQGVVNTINMLEMKFDTNFNKFTGCWIHTSEESNRTMYKIYSPGYVLLITSLNATEGKENLGCKVAEVEYMPDNTKITEMFGNGNECDINWIDDNTFELVWMSYGTPVAETWKRCGLPQSFQKLFGTNLPVLE